MAGVNDFYEIAYRDALIEKRDEFALAAMQGMLAANYDPDGGIARRAYDLAERMMAEREARIKREYGL